MESVEGKLSRLPCADLNSPIFWLFSCPFNGDNYLSQLIPVGAPSQAVPIPSYYQRFLVSTFTFVDSTTQLALEGLVNEYNVLCVSLSNALL